MQCQCPYLFRVLARQKVKSLNHSIMLTISLYYFIVNLGQFPYLVVAHLPRTRTLGVGLWEVKTTLRQFSTNQCAHLNRNVYNKQLLENVPILLTTQYYCIKSWLCYMCCASILSFVQFLFFIVSPSFPYTTIFQKQRKIKIEPQHTSHFNQMNFKNMYHLLMEPLLFCDSGTWSIWTPKGYSKVSDLFGCIY